MQHTKPSARMAKLTQELLRRNPRNLNFKQIAQETGVSLNWLYHFNTMKDPDASSSRVEALYEYLTQSKLRLIALAFVDDVRTDANAD